MIRTPSRALLGALSVVGAAMGLTVSCTIDLSGLDGGATDAGMPLAHDASSGADAVDAGSAECSGREGPVPVRVGSFCIDSTEVTRGHYRRFLDAIADGGAPTVPAACASQTTFLPGNDWPPAPRDLSYPVAYVNWCDSFAYCAWAGKHLCGDTRGGPLEPAAIDSVYDAWYLACSHDGERRYPYGDFQPGACNGKLLDAGQTLPVGTVPTCVGGYPGLFDMSGNVAEWIDACDNSDHCAGRGGGYELDGDDNNSCIVGGPPLGTSRWSRYSDVGFRCCSN